MLIFNSYKELSGDIEQHLNAEIISLTNPVREYRWFYEEGDIYVFNLKIEDDTFIGAKMVDGAWQYFMAFRGIDLNYEIVGKCIGTEKNKVLSEMTGKLWRDKVNEMLGNAQEQKRNSKRVPFFWYNNIFEGQVFYPAFSHIKIFPGVSIIDDVVPRIIDSFCFRSFIKI